MAQVAEEEEITDLHSFHQELQASYAQVDKLVSSWWSHDPSSASRSPQNVTETIPKGRPERLGLGATHAKSGYKANSQVDTAETKKLKQLISATGKRNRDEEPVAVPAQFSVGNGAHKPAEEDSEDEDSRAKAFSAKKAKRSGPIFHEKPAKKANAVSSAKHLARKKETEGEGFVAPAPPSGRAGKAGLLTSEESHRVTSNSSKAVAALPAVHATYALPSAGGQSAAGEEPEDDHLESVATEATQSTTVELATGSPNGQPKRKRKKKKKKKQTTAASAAGGTPAALSQPDGYLFGTSTVA